MPPTPWTPNRYPQSRRSDHVDTYKSETRGEVTVHDPYEWLEHNSEEKEQWINDQEAFTRSYLDANPNRAKLEEELKRNNDYAKLSLPDQKWDGRWYWYYNKGLQAQSVVYRSRDRNPPDFSKEDGPAGEVFFDPNLLTEDGTASLATTAFSRSGELFAYGISRSGSDFVTLYVRPTSAPFAQVDGQRPNHDDIKDDKRLSDELRFVKFSVIVWTHDSKGFFYQRYPGNDSNDPASEENTAIETGTDLNAMLYYHRIGTPQSEDILVLKDPEHPEWMWHADVSERDGRYLEVFVVKDTSRKNLLWVADLQENEIGPNMKWEKIIDEFRAEYDIVANEGTKFYIRTNNDAPQYKVITIDLADEQRLERDVIPEDKDARLQDVRTVNKDKFTIVYKRNVKDEIYIYDIPTGNRLTRLIPDFVGTIYVAARQRNPWFYVSLTGFTNPGMIGRYDFNEADESKRWNIVHKTKVGGLVPDDFIADQVWYESKDGTKVPMFVVRHKDTKLDGTAPCIQYGYGGFSISVNPFFSPSILTVMQIYGFILAVPNIRGGGEFGEDWHVAGIRERRVNVYDDFIAATQYLVKEKYAGAGKVVINGGSNGGTLVAACVNRAPQGTFGAAVAEVGVIDLLKFPNFTIGKAWTSDYGDPQDPHDFDFIYPISPLHNIPQGKDVVLPPMVLHTADHDDRVVPLHTFKFGATLQYLHPNNPHPLLVRIDKKAGHGAGKATEQRIKEAADKWGFAAQSLGLVWRT